MPLYDLPGSLLILYSFLSQFRRLVAYIAGRHKLLSNKLLFDDIKGLVCRMYRSTSQISWSALLRKFFFRAFGLQCVTNITS